MCGIAGIVGDTDLLEIQSLLHVIRHRGTSHRGYYFGKFFGVGHNRLAINDLSAYSDQPFVAGNLVVLFNGEIYNTKVNGFEKELDFIVAAYRSGAPITQVLEGQYAIVIVDMAQQTATMVRDMWGIIPLYYGYDAKGRFIFGSEKKVLEAANAKVITELAPDEARTIYFRHPKHQYAKTPAAPRRWQLNLGAYNETVALSLLKTSILKRCTHTDVGYSVALSGGLDSSLLVQLMCSMEMQVLAHTVGFEGGQDIEYASRLVKHLSQQGYNIKHRTQYITKQQILNDLPRMIHHLEDPVPNIIKLLAYIRNYYVAKSSESKVIISGEGSDEIFAGYPFFKTTDTPLELSLKRQRAVRSMRAINLDRVDRGGMAWTKEYRMPFLDYQFAQYVLSCAVHAGKQELRSMAEHVGVPGFILGRPKYGSDEEIFKQEVFEAASKIWVENVI